MLSNITIVGYARVITKYGDCNIINYSATTRYKDYSVTKCDDCIVTRFTRVSNKRLDRQSTAISKALLYQTTSLSLNRIQIDLQESIGRRLRQQWRTRSIDQFNDLNLFLFFNNVIRSPTSNTANGLTITLPCTTPNIISKSPILVQFLPLFVFYSFNYTVKSRGMCNRLLVLYWDARLTPGRPRDRISSTLVCLGYGWNKSRTSELRGLLSCIYTTWFP